MSFLKELFRKRKDNAEEKKYEALQVWGTLEALDQKTRLRDARFKKLEKTKVPEGLREWKHYDDIGENFRVDLVTVSDQFILKVSSNGHFFKSVIKGPYDTMPVVTEGREDFFTEIPAEIKESSLQFAGYFSRFIFHHWRQANPQAFQEAQ